MKNGLRIAGGLLLALQATAGLAAGEESSWFIDGELNAAYDSNVSRAMYERDVLEDSSVFANTAVAWNHEFGMLQALTLRGFVEGEALDDIDTLNRGTGGVQAIYRWQHSLGFSAPFFQVSATGQVDDYNSALRDADRVTLQAFGSKRFTDALRGSMGVEASRQEADGKVHDIEQARVFLNADLALNADWAMYGTYSAQYGDTVSSAQAVFCNGAPAGGELYGLVSAADEMEPDDALNEATCGQWVAYRLEAVTHMMVFGLNRGFGHTLSLDLSAQQVLVYAEGNNEYHRTIVRAGILARF